MRKTSECFPSCQTSGSATWWTARLELLAHAYTATSATQPKRAASWVTATISYKNSWGKARHSKQVYKREVIRWANVASTHASQKEKSFVLLSDFVQFWWCVQESTYRLVKMGDFFLSVLIYGPRESRIKQKREGSRTAEEQTRPLLEHLHALPRPQHLALNTGSLPFLPTFGDADEKRLAGQISFLFPPFCREYTQKVKFFQPYPIKEENWVLTARFDHW